MPWEGRGDLLCRQREILMEKGAGEKLLRALRPNEIGCACPGEAGIVRFHLKHPGAEVLPSFYR